MINIATFFINKISFLSRKTKLSMKKLILFFEKASIFDFYSLPNKTHKNEWYNGTLESVMEVINASIYMKIAICAFYYFHLSPVDYKKSLNKQHDTQHRR